jgi:predicted transcriptional regulator
MMRRNSLDIYADILRVSRSGAKKTHLVYRANLNFNIVKRYLTELTSKNLIENDGDMYFITDKGARFIESYDTLVEPFKNIK